jgi:6-phosphogluconolactonase (cycloisomerase 2 family)
MAFLSRYLCFLSGSLVIPEANSCSRRYSLPVYDNATVTFSTNISSAEVYASADGRFVYASMRNLTDASLIQPEDVSLLLPYTDVETCLLTMP